MHRFFCEELDGEVVSLDRSESHHAINVLRLNVGDPVVLFDGCGTTAEGTIARRTRSACDVQMSSRTRHDRPHGLRLTVASAVPKGDRLRFLAEKLTEIGVDRFVPLNTSRSVVDPRQAKLQKLAAAVVAATRQCERPWLMSIDGPSTLTSVLNDARSTDARVFIAHPAAPGTGREAVIEDAPDSAVLLIGPEGGFTDDEVSLAKDSGAVLLDWPGSILRIETAAIVFASRLLDRR
ncbi:MAG: RsmE family RNA methyltransferase [Planctomycetaceae bacterium]